MPYELSPAMKDSARQIGEATIAVHRAKGKAKLAAMDSLRAANRASREQHGEDLHNIVKGYALAGATGGRA